MRRRRHGRRRGGGRRVPLRQGAVQKPEGTRHATRGARVRGKRSQGALAARARAAPGVEATPVRAAAAPAGHHQEPLRRGAGGWGAGRDLADGGRGFAGVRWEEPRAKRARVASQVRTDPLKGDPDKTVFVRNLAFRADEGALAEFFAQCGEIVDLRLGRDAESGRSRGFCHVAYSTAEAAEKALALHETTFYGRDIVVQMAKSDEERNADRDRRREERRSGGCRRRPPAGAGSASRTRRTRTWWPASRASRSSPWIKAASCRITARWCPSSTRRASRR